MTDAPKNTRGQRANVVSMDKAARDLARQRKFRDDPAPLTPRGPNRIFAGKWSRGLDGMPTDPGCECPVEPIGFEGGTFYFIDSRGQFRSMKAADLNQSGIQDLFAAAPNYPKWMHPRWGKAKQGIDPETGEPYKPPIESFKADDIKETLFKACAYRGFFSPANKMRGRGGWTMRGGDIAYHAGDRIWQVDKHGRFTDLPTGVHHNWLYPRLAPLPEPWTEKIGDEENPARQLLQTFRTWTWTRPEIDPILMLGWLGNAYLGGALRWRPSLLLLGDRGTGKSFLQEGLRDIFGDALFHSADTTAAGIYQDMGHDSRAVALDELEPDADARNRHKIRLLAFPDAQLEGASTQCARMINLRAVLSRFLLLTIGRSLGPSQAEKAIFMAEERARESERASANARYLANLAPEISKCTSALTSRWPKWREQQTFYATAPPDAVIQVYFLHAWSFARQQHPAIADNDGILRMVVRNVLLANEAYSPAEIDHALAKLQS